MQMPKPLPRPTRTIVREIEKKSTLLYKNFLDFCKRVRGLKSIEDWNVKYLSDRIIFKKVADPYLLPELEVIVDDSLGFTVKSYACYLPEDHPVYAEHRRTIRDTAIWKLLKQLEGYFLCDGVDVVDMKSQLFHHIMPGRSTPMQELLP